MKIHRLPFFLIAIFVIACEPSPEIPGAGKAESLAIIKATPERRDKAEREWRRMLDTYGIAQSSPDLYPVTYTPRSLASISGGIKIMPGTPEPGTESIALREAVKRFLERWRELIGADPGNVSLASATTVDGNGQRLTYRQSNYPFPVTGGYGEMTVVISGDGRLLQLDDHFLPLVEVPLRPQIERDVAARRVVGRTYTYSDIAGREQRVEISNLDQVKVNRLAVVPIEKGDAIEVHLAWEIVAGGSLSWTVYIDATTGEELQAIQNFNT
ncbi:MAG: hypothetical protein L0229_09290 [Blastocatellia bacterium]|nr:hypothetical protein [Blastocatellia bacterium]